MPVNNSLAKRTSTATLSFQQVIKSANVQQNIMETLGDASKTKRFTASLISAVSTNSQLQECSGVSIISAALLGESLNLSPSPQLGHYYMVPFKDGHAGISKATFQLGYKGYIQLAIRSGQYKRLNVVAVKSGELVKFDPFNEDIEVNAIEDPDAREKAPTIGYYAMFELTNGFRKCIYWSKAKMEAHAEKYSMGYKAHKGFTFWERDFDGMAYKTMLRQLISKWGIMSIEMQNAYANDMSYRDTVDPSEAPKFTEPAEDAIDAEVNDAAPVVNAMTGEVTGPVSVAKKENEAQKGLKMAQDETAPSDSLVD